MTRPTISLQAAIGPGDPASNLFLVGISLIGGTDVIAGPTIIGQGTWVELADRCYHVSTRRGRQRLLEAYQAGTVGALLDNTDSQLGPLPPSGVTTLTDDSDVPLTDDSDDPFVVDTGDLGWVVKTNRAIRLTFTHNGVEYPAIYAYADQWVAAPEYPEGGTTSVTATDAFKIFTRINPLAGPFVGAGEDTGARINRILDLAAWPAALRDIDVGNATHQSTNMAQPIATQMRLAADSERGDLYVDGRGALTFRRRMSRYIDLRSRIPQWTIGDGPGELNPSEDPVTRDDDLVRNVARVSRAGGSMVTRTTSPPPLAYEESTYTRTDLTLADDIQVVDHAERVVRLFAEEQSRIESVTFEPDGVDDDEMWAMIVGARFGDRVRYNLRHRRSGEVFANDYFIEGIDHDIPVLGPGSWRTTFSLADATKYPTDPFTVGVSLIGGLAVLT